MYWNLNKPDHFITNEKWSLKYKTAVFAEWQFVLFWWKITYFSSLFIGRFWIRLCCRISGYLSTVKVPLTIGCLHIPQPVKHGFNLAYTILCELLTKMLWMEYINNCCTCSIVCIILWTPIDEFSLASITIHNPFCSEIFFFLPARFPLSLYCLGFIQKLQITVIYWDFRRFCRFCGIGRDLGILSSSDLALSQNEKFGLFNDTSTFLSYLMPNPSL